MNSSTAGEKERPAFLDAESIEDTTSFPFDLLERSRRRQRRIVESDSCRARSLWRQQGRVVYRSRIDSQEPRRSRGILHTNDALRLRDSLKDFSIGVDELAFRRRQVVTGLGGKERNGESNARYRDLSRPAQSTRHDFAEESDSQEHNEPRQPIRWRSGQLRYNSCPRARSNGSDDANHWRFIIGSANGGG